MKTERLFATSLMLVALINLVACTTKYEIVVQKEYLYLGIGKTLTTPIIAESPPDRQNYVEIEGATELDREKARNVILTNYSISLIGTTINGNKRLEAIAKQDADNQAQADVMNKAEQERVDGIVNSRVKELKSER